VQIVMNNFFKSFLLVVNLSQWFETFWRYFKVIDFGTHFGGYSHPGRGIFDWDSDLGIGGELNLPINGDE